MKLKEIFQTPEAKAVKSLAQLDEFFKANKDAIVDACTPLELVSGVKVRVATTVVCSRANGDLYLYRRTPPGAEQDPLRGTPGKFDTPKGVVPFVGPGKWYAVENQVSGQLIGIGLAHEYNPLGHQYEEFVLMPVAVFQTDAGGEAHLNSVADRVHEKLVGVESYEWIPAANITADNAMTKIIAAANCVQL